MKFQQDIKDGTSFGTSLLQLAGASLPLAETVGFYRVLEGFYNDSPELRNRLEDSLQRDGLTSLPMVASLVDSNLLEKMQEALKDSPSLISLFELWRQRIPSDSGKMIRRKLSPGISLRLPPLPLILQKCLDQFEIGLTANYAAPNGQGSAVASIKTLEGILLGDQEAYPQEGTYITEGGGTNGIYTVLQYLNTRFPGSTILCCGPNYFQFFENTRTAFTVINRDAQNGGLVNFLPTPAEVEAELTPAAKFLVITQPNNPTGEFYSKLVQTAKDRNLLIIDDAAFEELPFPSERSKFYSVAQVAYKLGALDRVVTIKSFSKGKNLPGERVGYVITSNPGFIRFLADSMITQRDCPSNLNSGMICLDSILRYVELETQQGADLDSAIRSAVELFPQGMRVVGLPINRKLAEVYIQQRQADMTAYEKSFEYLNAPARRSGIIDGISRATSAYNVLIKLPKLPRGMSMFQYAVNLFLEYGLETQWGPNFDKDTKKWEQKYGPWMRVTFSSDVPYLSDSFERIWKSFESLGSKTKEVFQTPLFGQPDIGK